jgi:hypothetical protein
VEAVLPLLGQDSLTDVEAALTLPRRRLRVLCYSARLSSPAAGHHYLRARCRDGTTRRLPARGAVTRRLGNRRAYRGISWADHALTWARTAHLPAFNAVVGLASRGGPSATGTW